MQENRKSENEPGLVWRAIHFLPFAGKSANDSKDAIKIGMLGASKGYCVRIDKACEGYEQVCSDDGVDVVYVGVPNGVHGTWSKYALNAGKHVLCEKPFASNEAEAREVQRVAKRQKRVCMEAFHYAHHPLFEHLRYLLQNEKIGEVKEIRTSFKRPKWCKLFTPNDIRYDFNLAGGATMDLGCYCIHAIRSLTQCSRPNVVQAYAFNPRNNQQIDEKMTCQLECTSKNQENAINAWMDVSLSEGWWFQNEISITGSRGKITCSNFLFPFWGHKVVIEDNEGKKHKTTCYGSGLSTYDYQLKQFAQDIESSKAKLNRERQMFLSQDSIDNMYVIDQVYLSAGMKIRSPYSSV